MYCILGTSKYYKQFSIRLVPQENYFHVSPKIRPTLKMSIAIIFSDRFYVNIIPKIIRVKIYSENGT